MRDRNSATPGPLVAAEPVCLVMAKPGPYFKLMPVSAFLIDLTCIGRFVWGSDRARYRTGRRRSRICFSDERHQELRPVRCPA